MSLQGLPTPTVDWSTSNADESFENFKETVELLFEAPLAELSEERKIACLKLWSGEEGRAIVKTWELTDDQQTLETYWAKFKDYVKPKSNFRIARFKLRECRQQEGEPIDMFVKRLRTILAECQYTAKEKNTHLIDSLIFGVKVEKVQAMLLQKDENLTIDEAVKIARTEEATRKQVDELRGKTIDMVSKQTTKSSPKNSQWRSDKHTRHPRTCGRCGNHSHKEGGKCPAKSSRCSKCQKIGHWRRACRSAPRSAPKPAPKHSYHQAKEYVKTTDNHTATSSKVHHLQIDVEPLFLDTMTTDSMNEMPPYAWHTVATDLFSWGGSNFLIAADPYSRFPVIRRLTSRSSQNVILHLRGIFDEYGVPEIVRSGNRSQYASSDFQKFGASYGFQHITSSSHQPQSNAFIERMIGTVKLMFDQAKETNSDSHLALLAYRSKPIDSNTASPAEMMFGRKIRTNSVER